MVEQMEAYNGLIEEEDILFKRIEVCQECMELILDHISDKADALHIPTTELILKSIDFIMKDFQTELLHLRIEKSILTREISKFGEDKRKSISIRMDMDANV